MKIIADLHVHSKYSRACSENLTLESMDAFAKQKGVGLVSTGDFTHPAWMKEIKGKLVESGEGIYKLNGRGAGTNFVIGAEMSTVFERAGRIKKVHNCVLVPNIEIAEQVNEALSKYGDRSSDGRITLNIELPNFVSLLRSISKDIFVFPAHAWTPWYSVFGAFSGFNSIEEAYGDQADHIYALETGLSSDPKMNWMISKLDKYTLVSNSDAHSPQKIGREANVFELDNLNYKELTDAIKKKDGSRLRMTIEFYPEEGKYHFDGHRNCNVSMSPEEAKKLNNICPVCRKKLTIGVMHRVYDLADRPFGFVPKNSIPYVHSMPLAELIAYMLRKGQSSIAVKELYDKLISEFGSELNVMLDSKLEDIYKIDKTLAEGIERVRTEKVHLIPGYDGVFGIVDVMNRVSEQRNQQYRQHSISEY